MSLAVQSPDSDPTTRVLVFDQSAESREVLRTLMERRGLRTVEVADAASAVRLAESESWALLVADVESDLSNDAASIVRLRQAALRKGAPFLLLGTIGKTGDLGRPESDTCMQKPYHYGALVHRIVELLGARPAA